MTADSRRAEDFFVWVRGNREARHREIADALQRLDVSGRRLPPPLARLNTDYWQEMADYFVTVCHHGRTTDEEEFLMYLNALETFLVERVQPRTFDHTEELEKLIGGAAESKDDEYGRLQDHTFISRPAIEEHPEQREQESSRRSGHSTLAGTA